MDFLTALIPESVLDVVEAAIWEDESQQRQVPQLPQQPQAQIHQKSRYTYVSPDLNEKAPWAEDKREDLEMRSASDSQNTPIRIQSQGRMLQFGSPGEILQEKFQLPSQQEQQQQHRQKQSRQQPQQKQKSNILPFRGNDNSRPAQKRTLFGSASADLAAPQLKRPNVASSAETVGTSHQQQLMPTASELNGSVISGSTPVEVRQHPPNISALTSATQQRASSATFLHDHSSSMQLQANKRNVATGDDKSTAPAENVGAGFREVFAFERFNRVQTACLDVLLESDRNCIVSAPTGAGKTTIFELSIVRLAKTGGFAQGAKVVYLAPLKSLCHEMAQQWRTKFKRIGLNIMEVTSDQDVQINLLMRQDVIVATPEKWDGITRRWQAAGKGLVGAVALLLVDEVHLLDEFSRGACLDATVSRMMAIQEQLRAPHLPNSEQECAIASLRIVAASATIPNIQDIADWLKCKSDGVKIFGPEFRPVPLAMHVLGYASAKNDYLFEQRLNFHVADVIRAYSEGKPSLVFCATRKSTIACAQEIARSNSLQLSFDTDSLMRASRLVKSPQLGECLRNGCAFHHAGLETGDRALVESLFRSGGLPVLCSTSTLAQGVNLPARLVIVKGTKFYGAHGYEDYSKLVILQMTGRAGRPQFDSEGVAVIMAEDSRVQQLHNIIHGSTEIESTLLTSLADHVNAEVALGTIKSREQATLWLRSTFCWHRALKNPRHKNYSIDVDAPVDAPTPELFGQRETRIKMFLEQRLFATIKQLLHCELVKPISAQQRDGYQLDPAETFESTSNGLAMARLSLKFESMRTFFNLPLEADVQTMLKAVSQAHEFADIQVRVAEKKFLNQLNTGKAVKARTTNNSIGQQAISSTVTGTCAPLPFPLSGKIQLGSDKVNVLLQSLLSHTIETLGGPEMASLKQEAGRVAEVAERLFRGLIIVLSNRNDGPNPLRLALHLHQSTVARMWAPGVIAGLESGVTALTSGAATANTPSEPTMSVLRQLQHVGPQIAQKLTRAGCWEFEHILRADPRWIESVTGRRPPFGTELRNAVLALPKVISVAMDVMLEHDRWVASAELKYSGPASGVAALTAILCIVPRKSATTKVEPVPKKSAKKKSNAEQQLPACSGRILETKRLFASNREQEASLTATFSKVDLVKWHLSDGQHVPLSTLEVICFAMFESFVGLDAKAVAAQTVNIQSSGNSFNGPSHRQEVKSGAPVVRLDAAAQAASSPPISASEERSLLETSYADIMHTSDQKAASREQALLRIVQEKRKDMIPPTPVTRLAARPQQIQRLSLPTPARRPSSLSFQSVTPMRATAARSPGSSSSSSSSARRTVGTSASRSEPESAFECRATFSSATAAAAPGPRPAPQAPDSWEKVQLESFFDGLF